MSKQWIICVVILLIRYASIIKATTDCVILNQVTKCVYTVSCEVFSGLAPNPNCVNEPHVTFQISKSHKDVLSSGFFTATNFDSRVRIFKAVNNTWTIISSSTFRYYTKTIEMDLSGNEIRDIQNGAFKNLFTLKTLNLSSNLIDTLYPHSILITDKIDNQLEVLDLSNNLLSFIPPNTFEECKSLQVLYLQNNKIANLEDDVFSNVKNLTRIFLQNNKLKALNMTLIHLKLLEQLDISFNRIEKVLGYEINRLESLEIVNMSYNNIEYIDSNCFNHAFNLKILDISNNKIKSPIVNIMFTNNGKLSYLDVSNNNIRQIQENSFKHNSLAFLNLDKNFIYGEITEETFCGLGKVQRLNLFNQNITSIKSYAFKEMTSLTELNLSMNNIHTIDETSFKNANLLGILDLSHNNLKNVNFFKDCLLNLTELFLNNNKIELIPANTFINQTLIKKLDISMNRIVSIEQYSLPLLNLQYFNISGNPISGVIKNKTYSPAKYLRYLDCSNLNISGIDDLAFTDLPVLARLNLSNNIIEYIGPKNFINLDNMFSLDLSKNRITNLKLNGTVIKSLNALYLNNNYLTNITGILPNSSQIMYLDVSYNNISEFIGLGFEILKNLRVLHASHNKIIMFNNAHLMSKLNNLGLSSNKISEIDLTFFKDLVSLDLSNNSIYNINNVLFQNLDNLQALDISNNKIAELPPGVFQNVKILKLLNISSNNLHDLRYGSLRGLHRTEVIDISRNKIAEMDVDIFHECPELSRLIIDYNYIQHLDVEHLIKLVPKLTSLSIGGNPLTCKQVVRNIKYIKTSVVRNIEITSIDKIYHEDNVHGIKCGNVDYTTSEMSLTSTSELHPESSYSSATLIWCSILTVLFAFLLAAFFYYKKKYSSRYFSQTRMQLGHSVDLSGSEFQSDLLN